MYLRKIFLVIMVVSGGSLLGYDHLLMNNLQSRHVRTVRLVDPVTAKTITQSFETLSKYRKQIKVKELLESPFIQQLFQDSLLRSPDQQVSDSVRSAQYLMLLHLYMTMFHQYIKTAESFLNDLIGAKKYWFYEDFYMSQSPLRRHPVYSMYSSTYKQNVQHRVAVLEELEGQVAHVLGMCLYGTQKISAIEREDQIVEFLAEAIKSLYGQYHVPYPLAEEQTEPTLLFQDLLWIYGAMAQNMESVKTELGENNKPSFVAEHWFGLTCTAAAVVAAYVVYKQNEEDIPRLKEKAATTAKYIWSDYIIIPIQELYAILWEGKQTKIPDVPEKAYLRKDLKLGVDLLLKDANETTRDLAKSYNALLGWAHELLPTIRGVVTSQQINLQLAAIGPIILSVYGAGKCTKAGYNRFVKHDNWYAPMKYSLRAADQLINSVARGNAHSFADDGKLYMLIKNVQQYIACLNNEELILMHTDLSDLLSFDLTYEQKHGVIERMYRTYQFLK